MSLQVWLPLNGNLNNQGLDGDFTITNSGATIDTSGKIGQCYSFNGSSSRICLSAKTYSYPLTMCAWIKMNNATDSNTEYICSYNTDSGGTAGHAIGFGIYSGKMSIWHGGSVVQYGTALSNNIWYHIAAVVTSSNYSLYINGSKVLETSGTQTNPGSKWITLGARSNSSTGGVGGAAYYFNGYMNDFRFYDHALSAKEIEEIAKGLVCHYKLDGEGCGNFNLIKGKFSSSTTNSSHTTNGTIVYDSSIIPLNNLKGKTLYLSYDYSIEGDKLNHTGNYNTDRYGIHGSLGYIDSGGTTRTAYPFASYLEVSGTGTAIQSYTFPVDAQSINSLTFAIQLFNRPSSNNLNTWYIKNVKLELDQATSYTINPNESGGFNTIFDVSGYENHGEYIGSVFTKPNTARYTCSTHFESGQYGIIKKSVQTYLPTSAITVNIWIKPSAWGNPISCTEGGGWNFENSSGIQFPVYIAGVGYKVANSGVQPADLLNNWHMLTGVFNGTEIKIYIDTVLKQTTATGSTNGIGYANNYLIISGEAQTTTPANSAFVGEESDIRIYATALTQEQILELYNTSVTIDKNGNVYAREVQEI